MKKLKLKKILIAAAAFLMAASPAIQAKATDTGSFGNPATAVSEGNEEEVLYEKLADSANRLHLSFYELHLKKGETYEVSVVPKELAQLPGWEISKVDITNNLNDKYLEVQEIDQERMVIVLRGKVTGPTVSLKVRLVNTLLAADPKYAGLSARTLGCRVRVTDTETRIISLQAVNSAINENREKNEETALKKFDTTDWRFDDSTLVFSYDGKMHLPVMAGLPEGVKVSYSSKGGVNAGEYSVTASFEVPEGYEPVEDMTVTYRINPLLIKAILTISDQYLVTARFEGILEQDGDAAANYVINKKDYGTESQKLEKPDRYSVLASPVFEDESLNGNYYCLPTAIQFERDKAWFRLSLGEAVVADGTVTVPVYVDEVKFDTSVPDLVSWEDPAPIVDLLVNANLEYDTALLQLQQNLKSGEENWSAQYSSEYGNFSVHYKSSEKALSEGKMLACSLVFDIIDSEKLKDTEVVLRNPAAFSMYGSYTDFDFSYYSDTVAVVINPTPDRPKDIEIEIEGDYQDDATFNSANSVVLPDLDDLEDADQETIEWILSAIEESKQIEKEYRDLLQKYIDNNFVKEYSGYGWLSLDNSNDIVCEINDTETALNDIDAAMGDMAEIDAESEDVAEGEAEIEGDAEDEIETDAIADSETGTNAVAEGEAEIDAVAEGEVEINAVAEGEIEIDVTVDDEIENEGNADDKTEINADADEADTDTEKSAQDDVSEIIDDGEESYIVVATVGSDMGIVDNEDAAVYSDSDVDCDMDAQDNNGETVAELNVDSKI